MTSRLYVNGFVIVIFAIITQFGEVKTGVARSLQDETGFTRRRGESGVDT